MEIIFGHDWGGYPISYQNIWRHSRLTHILENKLHFLKKELIRRKSIVRFSSQNKGQSSSIGIRINPLKTTKKVGNEEKNKGSKIRKQNIQEEGALMLELGYIISLKDKYLVTPPNPNNEDHFMEH